MNTSASTHANTETPGSSSSSRGPGPALGACDLPLTAPSAPTMKVDPVELQQMHEAGATDPEMAGRFGVKCSTIYFWRMTLGLSCNRTPRAQYKRRKDAGKRTHRASPGRVLDPATAITLRALGLSYAAIGDLCGVSRVAAFQCIRRHAQ